ncbi:heterokaryon incompatibility protein-domain-containing protein [Rhexocercosporidium sp. MPI-PUGE-AT-0058]|nr:heterokaryon incompatibility protein-domain-containing protein [Rhexocercosporidium sp. MPI-PUGE-AT-0058]
MDDGSKENSSPCLSISPQILNDWIMECETKHNHPTIGNFTRHQLSIDILPIDVEENRLVEATSKSRFFALSYVWGKQEMFMTTSSNRYDMGKPGALCLPECPIPPVFRDAMKLVSMPSERYLWVDALCIEQDNPSQKHQQIKDMDIIYSQAVVIIVALSVVDAQSSLPGVRPMTRLPSNVVATARRFRVRAGPPSFQCCLDNSEYETRAWTYQERTLSRRCLFFTNHENA